MQTTEQKDITLPPHNWDALKELEWEKDCLFRGSATFWIAMFATGVFVSIAWVVMGLVYKPLVRVTKLARIIKVMRPLLEEFEGQGIQIFPCLEVAGHEPLDFYIRFPEAHLLISMRSMGKSEIVYKETKETLFVRRKGKGIKKWHPDPLVELSEYQASLIKNRQQFGMASREVRKPLAKVLVISGETTIDEHEEHLYATLSGERFLALNRKGTAFVIKENQLINFMKAYIVAYQTQKV
ncbi:hypothetical protein Cri9333_4705 (plasmid) [Crinalium epipsammum PCC 9333]|uniref:NERD domain-containing protein n=1 Tax=Crinalium epipsammum PCC 9333 TaxID=1173022 RepID=K9W6Q2_9CYAN|nr:hypothetical protein [Crinalium epipsammum]AFZ15484.1 hypothetical protein Cri9333_4705 [Crinalium epipsammum PCC 9333]